MSRDIVAVFISLIAIMTLPHEVLIRITYVPDDEWQSYYLGKSADIEEFYAVSETLEEAKKNA